MLSDTSAVSACLGLVSDAEARRLGAAMNASSQLRKAIDILLPVARKHAEQESSEDISPERSAT